MIRILQCIVGMNRGGLETFTMNLLRKMDSSKIQFDFLVSIPGVFDKEIRQLGGQIYQIPFISKVGPFAYAKNLRHFFESHPDYRVIHIQMDKFGGMVAREAARCGVPVRIIHAHSTQNEGGITYRLVKDYYGRLVPQYGTHLLACSRDAATWMFEKRAREARIVHNGIDLELFPPADKRNASSFTVGHVGRFTPVKNHAFLIDIFTEVLKLEPESRLLLAGCGELEDQTRAKVAQLGIADRVFFLGQRDDMGNVLAQCDVLCMPSLHEGVPMSLVEAQACGVPCLASDCISEETNLSGAVDFLSLCQPPSVWATTLLAHKGQPRQNSHSMLESLGYSIQHVAKEMNAYYQALATGLSPSTANNLHENI